MSDMKDKRRKGTLLLGLLINLTACQTWQPVSLEALSPAQFVEEDQPDRVRVTGRGLLEREVAMPTVTGDHLVGMNGFSMPLEDIYEIEIRTLNPMGTALLAIGAIPVLVLAGMLACSFTPSDPSCMI